MSNLSTNSTVNGVVMKKTTALNSTHIRFIIAGGLLLLGGGAWLLAKYAAGFADWYGFNVYPVVVRVFAGINNIFPFSLAEVLIILGSLTLLFLIGFFIFRLIKGKGERLRFLLASLSVVLLILSAILFLFVFGCGINYHRKPFSEFSGLTLEKYSKEQVYEPLIHVINEVNELSREIELDENNLCVIPDGITGKASEAMYNLSETYPVLDTFYPNAKAVMLSELMCYGRITGVFTPFTIEANYNYIDTSESIGHTICHELSHLSGFMQEEEANFVAYLACRESDDPYLRYSGYYSVMNYLLNAYAGVATGEEYVAVLSLVNPATYSQMVNASEFWKKYETDFGEVAETINDTYLKANDQDDGIKSYGRVVDLAIADYYKNIKN